MDMRLNLIDLTVDGQNSFEHQVQQHEPDGLTRLSLETCSKLDATDELNALVEMGRSRAHEVVDEVAPQFFAASVPPYTPFNDDTRGPQAQQRLVSFSKEKHGDTNS